MEACCPSEGLSFGFVLFFVQTSSAFHTFKGENSRLVFYFFPFIGIEEFGFKIKTTVSSNKCKNNFFFARVKMMF